MLLTRAANEQAFACSSSSSITGVVSYVSGDPSHHLALQAVTAVWQLHEWQSKAARAVVAPAVAHAGRVGAGYSWRS